MRQRGGDFFLDPQPWFRWLQTQSHKLRPDPKNQLLPPHYSSSATQLQDTSPKSVIGHRSLWMLLSHTQFANELWGVLKLGTSLAMGIFFPFFFFKAFNMNNTKKHLFEHFIFPFIRAILSWTFFLISKWLFLFVVKLSNDV